MTTPLEFAAALLDRLGVPRTDNRLRSIVLFAAKEGGHWVNPRARYNPMNTSLSAPGAVNAIGAVKAYPDWATGIAATAQTIGQSNMRPIADALRTDASPFEFLTAVTATPWCPQSAPGCGNYATGNLDVLYNSYANKQDGQADLATTTPTWKMVAGGLLILGAAGGTAWYLNKHGLKLPRLPRFL